MRKERALARTSVLIILALSVTVSLAGTNADLDPAFHSEPGVGEPATLIGDVLVETDSLGRLVVLVDEASADAAPDGIADRAFVLKSNAPIDQFVHQRMPLASVIFRRGSLLVSAPGTGFTVDLAIATGTATR